VVLYQLDLNFVRRQAHRVMRHSGLLGMLRVVISVAAGFFGLSRAVNDVLADLTVSAQSRMEARDTIQEILSNWLNRSRRRLSGRCRPTPRSCRASSRY
jgi:hypothetical protein